MKEEAEEDEESDPEAPSKHIKFLDEVPRGREREIDQFAWDEYKISDYSRLVRNENRLARRKKYRLEVPSFAPVCPVIGYFSLFHTLRTKKTIGRINCRVLKGAVCAIRARKHF